MKNSLSRAAKGDRRNPVWGWGPGRARLWMAMTSTVFGVRLMSFDEPWPNMLERSTGVPRS